MSFLDNRPAPDAHPRDLALCIAVLMVRKESRVIEMCPLPKNDPQTASDHC